MMMTAHNQMKKAYSAKSKGMGDKSGDLIKLLHGIRDKAKNEERDRVIMVVGKERSGKSTLAAHVINQMYPNWGEEKYLTFNPQKFHNAIKEPAPPGKIIWLDEGVNLLFARESMKPENLSIIKKFMICGYKYFIFIVCIPDFFSIDRYIREQRVDLIFRIPEKGKFLLYGGQKALYRINQQGDFKGVHALTAGWYAKKMPEEIYRFYRRVEKHDKDKIIGGDETAKHISANNLGKMAGISPNTIVSYIKRGIIRGTKVGDVWRIPLDKAVAFLELFKAGHQHPPERDNTQTEDSMGGGSYLTKKVDDGGASAGEGGDDE